MKDKFYVAYTNRNIEYKILTLKFILGYGTQTDDIYLYIL